MLLFFCSAVSGDRYSLQGDLFILSECTPEGNVQLRKPNILKKSVFFTFLFRLLRREDLRIYLFGGRASFSEKGAFFEIDTEREDEIRAL